MSEIAKDAIERIDAIESLVLPRFNYRQKRRIVQGMAKTIMGDIAELQDEADRAKSKSDLAMLSSHRQTFEMIEQARVGIQAELNALRGVSSIPGQLELIDVRNLDDVDNQLIKEVGQA